MEAVKCPVCKGRGTVKEGFYKPSEPDLARPKCRSCDGNGYVALPEPSDPAPTHLPLPYPAWPNTGWPYPASPGWPWPNTIWSGSSAQPVTFEQRTFGIGETITTTPFGIVSTGTAIGN